jgi:hypothetical protein
VTIETRLWCPQCDAAAEPTATYECGRCGAITDERRCQDCGIFGARTDFEGCDVCFSELETRELALDHDGTWIPIGDYQADGPSLAERNRAQSERARSESAARFAAATRTIPASSLKVGDAIALGRIGAGVRSAIVEEIWHPSADDLTVVLRADRKSVRGYRSTDEVVLALTPAPPSKKPIHPKHGVGGFAADEVRTGLSMALGVPLVVVEAGRRSWTARMATAVSQPGALAIADRFDEMAASLVSAPRDVRRAHVVSDDDLFVDETLTEIDAWQHHAGDHYVAEGYVNTATGAYIDSPSLFATAAAELRVLAERLPDQ